VSNGVLDALRLSLLAPKKTHKINVVNQPGRYQQTDMQAINTTQTLMEVFPVVTMGISIEPGGPDSTKHLGSCHPIDFPFKLMGSLGLKSSLNLGISD